MSLEIVLDTLAGNDPEFWLLAEALYGPEVTIEQVYADLLGQSPDFVRDPEVVEHRYDVAKGLMSEFVDNAKIGFRAAKPTPKMGPLTESEMLKHQQKLARSQAVGLTLRHPLKAAQANPLPAAAVGVGLGALAVHRHNSQQVTYDPTTGVYKLDREKVLHHAGLAATLAGTGLGVGEVAHAAEEGGFGARAQRVAARPGVMRALKPFKAITGTPKRTAALASGMLLGDLAAVHTLKKPQQVNKADDFVAEGTFTKFDDDKRLAFGWASVVQKDGLPVVDRQGDYIDPNDLEEAAYRYVLSCRVGGDMHRRAGVSKHGLVDRLDDRPHHVSDLVESFVVTPEKIEKMGLPKTTPLGWWVGFKVHDDDTWAEVKKGGRTGFSIHGKGKRVDTSMDELVMT